MVTASCNDGCGSDSGGCRYNKTIFPPLVLCVTLEISDHMGLTRLLLPHNTMPEHVAPSNYECTVDQSVINLPSNSTPTVNPHS